VLGRRPDLAAFQQREEQHAQGLRQLAPGHRARPSLLAPALRAGFWALGAAAAVAPRQLSAAVTAGIHDALTDVCNEQLREMREEGLSEGAPQVGMCLYCTAIQVVRQLASHAAFGLKQTHCVLPAN
jgi:demethoxyubiquinone hydroxylase (CLK1/Coq7/Cat5 family)